MDIHVHHLASLCRNCGKKIKDHKRKVDANRFVSNIHQIWKDLVLLDSPNVHPQCEKKIIERRQISIIIDKPFVLYEVFTHHPSKVGAKRPAVLSTFCRGS